MTTTTRKPACSMCDGTGFKDYAALCIEPCDHEIPPRAHFLSTESLDALARAASIVPVIAEDRIEFGRALILQGYDPGIAAEMAATTIKDNDGALQMLARHRLRYAPKGPVT